MEHPKIDARATELAALDGPDDELINGTALAEWLGVSINWVHISRQYGYGPNFVKLAPRQIRYRRGDVRAWLRSRTHASTKEYSDAAA